MKKLLTIILLFAVVSAKSQVLDTLNKLLFDPQRGTVWISKPAGDPITFTQDSIRMTDLIDGSYYTKLFLTKWKASDFGIYPGTTNNFQRIQSMYNRQYVAEVEFFSDSVRDYRYSGTLKLNNKKITLSNGAKLKGTGSTDSLFNAVVDADKYAWIFDNVKLGTGIRTSSPMYSVRWWGINETNTGAQNMAKVDNVVAFSVKNDGGNFLWPGGLYKLGKYTDSKVIQLKSNTHYWGEGDATHLKVDTTMLWDFTRMFEANNGVKNFGVHRMWLDGSNKVKHYDSVKYYFKEQDGDSATDGHSAGIFTYSSDANNPVSNGIFEDLLITDWTGDSWNISANSHHMISQRIRQRDFLRQGAQIGGGGVDDVNYEYVTDDENLIVIQIGGHSMHSEPALPQLNVNVRNCNVNSFSMSGIKGGNFDNVTSRSTKTVFFNLVSGITITKCKFTGQLQVSPYPEGNVHVTGNDYITGGIYVTTVSGYVAKTGPVTLTDNFVYGTGIQVNGVDSVRTNLNHVKVKGVQAIRYSNQVGGSILNNEAWVDSTGNFQAIYVYASTGTKYGTDGCYIDGNYGRSPYRFIQVTGKYSIIGPSNYGIAPTFISLTNAGTGSVALGRLMPFRDGAGRQILNTTVLPTHNLWAVGDQINIKQTGYGDPLTWTVLVAGALHEGYWISGATYYTGHWVRDTGRVSGVFTTRYYKSIAQGGGAERPFDDTDNTYWQQVSTTEAFIVSSNATGVLKTGTGSPEGVVPGRPGTIYTRQNPTDTTNILYLKYTAAGANPDTSRSGWVLVPKGSGAGSGGLTAGQIQDKIDSTLTAQVERTLRIKNLGTLGDSVLVKVNDSTLGAKRLRGTGGISITRTDTTIVFNFSGGSGGNADSAYILHLIDSLGALIDDTLAIRNAMGAGDSIAKLTGSSVIFKRLIAGTNISFTRTDTSITINASSGGISDGNKGDITVSGSGATWTINNNAITYAKMQQSIALSVLGRAANSTGNIDAISSTADFQVLRRNGTSIAFGSINLASTNAVTGILARANGGTGLNTIGSEGQVLKVVSGVLAYANDLTSAGTFAPGNLVQVNNNDYTVAAGVFSIVFYGHTTSKNLVLPSAAANLNRVITVQNRGSGNVIPNVMIRENSGGFIAWSPGYGSILQSDGTDWWQIVSANP